MALPLANSKIEQNCNIRRATVRPALLSRLLTFWHLTSFDAPTVAVVWAFAFAQVEGRHLQPWIALLLFSGTWSVYVGDRLLDGHRAIRSGQLDALRERHFFHWRHRRALIPLASCSAGLAAILIMHLMPAAIRERNSVLAAAALMYFSGVHSSPQLPKWLRKIGSKELIVGVLFTAGCAAPTLWQMHSAASRLSNSWPLLVCFTFLAVLAWCNCQAIESWESGDNQDNVAMHAGLLSVTGVLIAVAFSYSHPGAAVLVATAASSSLLLLVLDRMRFRLSPLMLRALADVVLLAPVVVLVLGAHPA